MSKPGDLPPTREDYTYFHPVPTRWADNDVYGHINNVAYYAFFDTAVNAFLISRCGLDIENGPVIGLVVETGCRYFSALSYPVDLSVGVRVDRLGSTSVTYAVAVFSEGEEQASAAGKFVHVYVDRHVRRPVPLPEQMRTGLHALVRE